MTIERAIALLILLIVLIVVIVVVFRVLDESAASQIIEYAAGPRGGIGV